MGTFRVDRRVENVADRHRSTKVNKLLVDTGSNYTWLPSKALERIGIQRVKKDIAIQMANRKEITRSVGFAIIHVGDFFTVDEVVFGEEGDLSLLGARTLEGFNAVVDPKRKKLVAAGPITAASGK